MKKSKESNVTSSEEIKPIKQPFFDRIPFAVKALFIKFWFFGALYFFVNMGLGSIIEPAAGNLNAAAIILWLIMGLILGVVTDFLVNNILITIESDKHEARYYRIFKNKKIYSLLINIVYALVLSFVWVNLCQIINSACSGMSAINWVCAEPFTCAFIALAIDAVFITIRNLVVKLYYRISKKEVR